MTRRRGRTGAVHGRGHSPPPSAFPFFFFFRGPAFLQTPFDTADGGALPVAMAPPLGLTPAHVPSQPRGSGSFVSALEGGGPGLFWGVRGGDGELHR